MPTPSLRRLLAVAALALAALSAAEWLGFRSEIRRLEGLLERGAVGADDPRLAADLRHSRGGARSAVRAARALLAAEVERGPDGADGGASAGLEAARQLAAESLLRHPGSWQAWMIWGEANYLDLSRRADPDLQRQPELWEAPLLRARQLAPGQPEPVRLLAAAYLSSWMRFDEEKRRQALPVIGEALGNRQSFDLLYPSWLRRAPSLEQALELTPDASWAWERALSIFAGERDWERWCQVRERWLGALESELERALRRAREERAGGRPREALRGLATALAPLPPDDRLRRQVAEGVELLAAEPRPRLFGPWLRWALRHCVYSGCPFDAATLSRLERLAGPLEPAERALARAAQGALGDGRPLGSRSTDRQWAEALLIEGRRLRERRSDAAALSILGRARDRLEDSPHLWREIAAVAPLGSESAAAAARRLREMEAEAWPAAGWSRRNGRFERALLPSRAAEGLEIEIPLADDAGAALGVRWDGREVACRTAATGAWLRLELEVGVRPHRLEIERLAGARVTPGAVRLWRRPAVRSASASR